MFENVRKINRTLIGYSSKAKVFPVTAPETCFGIPPKSPEVSKKLGPVSNNPTLRSAPRRPEPHARPRLLETRASGHVRTEGRSESAAPRPPGRSRGARIPLVRAVMETHGENAPLLKTTRRHSSATFTSVRAGVAAIIVAGCVVAALAVSGQLQNAPEPVERTATVSRPQALTTGNTKQGKLGVPSIPAIGAADDEADDGDDDDDESPLGPEDPEPALGAENDEASFLTSRVV